MTLVECTVYSASIEEIPCGNVVEAVHFLVGYISTIRVFFARDTVATQRNCGILKFHQRRPLGLIVGWRAI
jgi:hypothetical protein